MFKTILESWCSINCSGGWQADLTINPWVLDLKLDAVDDLMLFMMSHEYSYMGNPEPSRAV